MRILLTLLIVLGLSSCSAGGEREIFRDDFDTLENWVAEEGEGRWGTGEIERMSRANLAVSGGRLAITPRLEAGEWTSGRIRSKREDFGVPPGGTLRVEARIALPAVTPADGQGYWPAFWMLGGHTGWPEIGEIDILEAVNGQPSVMGAVHCGQPCNEPVGLTTGQRPCPTCFGGFHTYAVELTGTSVTWFLDGVPYHTLERGLDRRFFLILNVAIGGVLPGPPAVTTAPGRPMLVDYVSVTSAGAGKPGDHQ
ncbi:family 16 glycosylhydrolase [Nonomuraea sp. NPDC050663]|uniref:family 16 glycosylhydrolase n=1 Tax=Nonomuraea sp. NPDC050663 TaxID=3364370 RepID=UPI0037A831B9